MKRLLALLVASVAVIVLATPVGAGGMIGHPGEIATGYLELTEYEVADLVDARIAAGDLDADKVYKTSTGIILFGTPVDLLIDAGVIREFLRRPVRRCAPFRRPVLGAESRHAAD